MKSKEKKVCFICSSGGHFSELKKLQKISSRYDSFLVTEKTDGFKTDFAKKVYLTKEINRNESLFLLHVLILCIKELVIFLKEKPDVIISTGALCAYPMIRIAKIFKKKVVYIESYARVDDLSLTGEKVYKYADLFLVQWPDLEKKYEKAVFIDSLFGGKTR